MGPNGSLDRHSRTRGLNGTLRVPSLPRGRPILRQNRRERPVAHLDGTYGSLFGPVVDTNNTIGFKLSKFLYFSKTVQLVRRLRSEPDTLSWQSLVG